MPFITRDEASKKIQNIPRDELRKSVIIKNLEGEEIVRKQGETYYLDMALSNLGHCKVRILDVTESIHVNDVEDCLLIIGPVCESFSITNAKRCQVYVATKQFRPTDCQDCEFYLYAKSGPFFENCYNNRVFPWNVRYAWQSEQFEAANFDPSKNLYQNIHDGATVDFEKEHPKPRYELCTPQENVDIIVDGEDGELVNATGFDYFSETHEQSIQESFNQLTEQDTWKDLVANLVFRVLQLFPLFP